MGQEFRSYLKKVGSGQHTSKNLSRGEAAIAATLMLEGEATPAQIGAFLIAHRIKRPTGEELAGFLDAYDQFAQPIEAIKTPPRRPWVFGIPYDGRSRTAPILPLVSLLLAAAGQPVILHGAGTMPTKYGLGLTTIWEDLGLPLRQLSLSHCQQLLENHQWTFYYTPAHFPASQPLNDYRDQIGKRPPLATLDLIWPPYKGDHRLFVGYVHPPTETMIRAALTLRGATQFCLVKGCEGSVDLHLNQTTIVGLPTTTPAGYQYLKLNPRPHHLNHSDPPLQSREAYKKQLQRFLSDPPAAMSLPLEAAFLWNGAFYLWQSGLCADMATGITLTQEYWRSGKIQARWQQLQQAIAKMVPSV